MQRLPSLLPRLERLGVSASGHCEIALSPRAVSDLEADTLYAIGSPEVYRTLTMERGWSSSRFAAWYADVLVRLLGDPVPTA